MERILIKREWYDIIRKHKSVNLPLVINAVCNYAFYGEMPENLPLLEEMAFEFIKIDIDRQLEEIKHNETQQLRQTKEYRDWRKAVFERDRYTCLHCGDTESELNAHHIKPFSIYPESRFDINNGLTLCKKCHVKLHKTEREWQRH